MSSFRDKGFVMFECDGKRHGHACQEHETGEGFGETWDCLKAEGWKTYKKGSAWLHFCPKCQSDDLSQLTKGLK